MVDGLMDGDWGLGGGRDKRGFEFDWIRRE